MRITSMKNTHCNVRSFKPLTCKSNIVVKPFCRITGTKLQDLIRDRFLLRVYNGWSFPALFFLEEKENAPLSGPTQVNYVQNIYPEIIFNILARSTSVKITGDPVYPLLDVRRAREEKENLISYKKSVLPMYQSKVKVNLWKKFYPAAHRQTHLIFNTGFGISDTVSSKVFGTVSGATGGIFEFNEGPKDLGLGLWPLKLSPVSLPTSGLRYKETARLEYKETAGEYKETAPGETVYGETGPGSRNIRNIFLTVLQGQGTQLAEKLVGNTFWAFTEKTLERYIAAIGKFERVINKIPVFEQTKQAKETKETRQTREIKETKETKETKEPKETKETKANNLIESYASFGLEFVDIKNAYDPIVFRIPGEKVLPDIQAPGKDYPFILKTLMPGKKYLSILKVQALGKEYLSILKTLVSDRDHPSIWNKAVPGKEYASILKTLVLDRDHLYIWNKAVPGKEYASILKTLVLDRDHLSIWNKAVPGKGYASILKTLVSDRNHLSNWNKAVPGKGYASILKTLVLERESSSDLIQGPGKETLSGGEIPLSGMKSLPVSKKASSLIFLGINDKIFTRLLAGRQILETSKMDYSRFGLSDKLIYGEKGAGGRELVIQARPFAAQNLDYLSEQSEDMPSESIYTKSIHLKSIFSKNIHFKGIHSEGIHYKSMHSESKQSNDMRSGNMHLNNKWFEIVSLIAPKIGGQVAEKQFKQQEKSLYSPAGKSLYSPMEIQVESNYGKAIYENREGFGGLFEGYSLPSLPTSGLRYKETVRLEYKETAGEYKETAPGETVHGETGPGSRNIRNIFLNVLQGQGTQLAEKLVGNTFWAFTEKTLERYIAAIGKFERVINKIPVFKQTKQAKETKETRQTREIKETKETKETKVKNLIESYVSFGLELIDIKNAYDPITLRIPGEKVLPDIQAPGKDYPFILKTLIPGKKYLSILRIQALGKEYLSILKTLVSDRDHPSILNKAVPGKGYASILKKLVSERESQAVLKIQVPGQETLSGEEIPLSGMKSLPVSKTATASSLIFFGITDKIFTRLLTGKQIPETSKMDYSRFGLSDKLSYGEKGASGRELAIPAHPFAAQNSDYLSEQSEDMPSGSIYTKSIHFKSILSKNIQSEGIRTKGLHFEGIHSKGIGIHSKSMHSESIQSNKMRSGNMHLNNKWFEIVSLIAPKIGGQVAEKQFKQQEKSLYSPAGKSLYSPMEIQVESNYGKAIYENREGFGGLFEGYSLPSLPSLPTSGLRYKETVRLEYKETAGEYKETAPGETVHGETGPGSRNIRNIFLNVLQGQGTELAEKLVRNIFTVRREYPTVLKTASKIVIGLNFGITDKIFTRLLAGKQIPETSKMDYSRFGLSDKLSYGEKGAGGQELIIQARPFAAQNLDYLSEQSEDMPSESIYKKSIHLKRILSKNIHSKGIHSESLRSMRSGNMHLNNKWFKMVSLITPIIGGQVVEKQFKQQEPAEKSLYSPMEIQVKSNYGGNAIYENREGLGGPFEGYSLASLPTSGLRYKETVRLEYKEPAGQYKETAPGETVHGETGPGSRNIRNIIWTALQGQETQLAEKLVRNVFKKFTEKRLERYLAAKEKFERAIAKNLFFNQKEGDKNDLIESYASFKSELFEIKMPFAVNIPRMGRDMPPIPKIQITGLEYHNMLSGLNFEKIAENLFTRIKETIKNSEVYKRGYSRILERENQTLVRKMQSTQTYSNQEVLIKRNENNQAVSIILQHKDHLVLSGKVNYQDSGGSALELVIPARSTLTPSDSSGYARNMPPIVHKSEQQGVKQPSKQRDLVVKSLNTPRDSKTLTLKESLDDVDLLNPAKINKLVEKVYSQLEAKLAWERRRYGY